MKKGLWLCLLFLCSCLLIGCEKEFSLTKEEVKFKKEYESLNGKMTESGKVHLPIFLDEKTGVNYQTAPEIVDILKKGTGVIYLGFPECPWCRCALPALLEAMEEEEYSKLYYFNAKDIRDQKHLDAAGNMIVDKEGTKEYQEMLTLLDDYLPPYDGLGDPSIKRLYLPTVIFVKEGKIKGVHAGTVESQKDPYQGLTEEEEDKLEDLYEGYIKQVKGTMCGKSGC